MRSIKKKVMIKTCSVTRVIDTIDIVYRRVNIETHEQILNQVKDKIYASIWWGL